MTDNPKQFLSRAEESAIENPKMVKIPPNVLARADQVMRL
jgi:hypothetical protein